MKTFAQRIEERIKSCVTVQDWQQAYSWLAQEANDINDNALQMEAAIIKKYGEHALDELIEIAQAEPAPLRQENENIKLISQERALSCFRKGCDIELITGVLSIKALTEEEIINHSGDFGISPEQFASIIFEEMINFENSREE